MESNATIGIKDEEFILKHLDRFGNCGVGRVIVKKYGKETLLSYLKEKGYKCRLEIITKDGKKIPANVKYPTEATYILWLR